MHVMKHMCDKPIIMHTTSESPQMCNRVGLMHTIKATTGEYIKQNNFSGIPAMFANRYSTSVIAAVTLDTNL